MPETTKIAARLTALAATALLLAACQGTSTTTDDPTTAAPASDGGSSTTASEEATSTPTDDGSESSGSGTASSSESASSSGGSSAASDLEDYALEGGYAFSALDKDIYCVVNLEGSQGTTKVGDELGLPEMPGVYCLMATFAEPDEQDSQDDGIAKCKEMRDEHGVGDLAGGEPALAPDQVSYAGCRSDVSPFRGSKTDVHEKLSDVKALEPGQSVKADGYTCEATDGNLQCTREDGRGWKVSPTEYSMIS